MIFASQNSRFTHFLCFWVALPSGKRLHNYGKSPFFIFKIHCKWPCSIANCSSLPEATFSHYHVPIKSQKQRCVSKICSAPAPRKPVRTVTGTSTRRKKKQCCGSVFGRVIARIHGNTIQLKPCTSYKWL